MIKTGIFGGSFDPLHYGHLAIARDALAECGLDEVWLMVSPQNPLKQDRRLTPEPLRLQMARIGVDELPDDLRGRIIVSDFEMQLPKPTYTISTLHALDRAFSNREFHIIIGEDNFLNFSRWRSADEIAGRHHLIVYPRAGEENVAEGTDARKFHEAMSKYGRNCVILKNVPLLPVSSTLIRERAARGEDISALAGRRLAEFITSNKIYSSK